jgi:hypothetical protein
LNHTDDRGPSSKGSRSTRAWKASRRKQFRIGPSRRRSLLPCRRGQIWSWTRRIRKLLAAAWPMSSGFAIELLKATPSRSKPCAPTRYCAFKSRPPYSCGWLKIARRLASSPDQFRSRPGGSASRCGWRATPRYRLRRGGGQSAGCARLVQIQPPHPRPCNHRQRNLDGLPITLE